jgi:hypothetical protein
MIIYNVTTHVEDEILKSWITWMKEIHIPEVLATGKFVEARFCKVLVEEQGGSTYSVQFVATSRENLDLYYKEDATVLRQKGVELFGDKFLAFRTELELISQL